MSRFPRIGHSEPNPFNLPLLHSFIPSVIKLRSPSRSMPGQPGCYLNRPAMLQIVGNPRTTKRVATNLHRQPNRRSTPAALHPRRRPDANRLCRQLPTLRPTQLQRHPLSTSGRSYRCTRTNAQRAFWRKPPANPYSATLHHLLNSSHLIMAEEKDGQKATTLAGCFPAV